MGNAYILIIIMLTNYGGAAPASVEFRSERACVAASDAIKERFRGNVYVLCAEKQK